MKKLILAMLLLGTLVLPVGAMEFEAPRAPAQVRRQVEKPADSFGEGLWNVIRAAVEALDPAFADGCRSCLSVCAAMLLCGLVRQMAPGLSAPAMELACTLAAAAALLEPSSSMIRQGEETVRQLNDYGKLLLPVMTAALAAQGGVTASAALYTATAVFNSILSAAITRLMIPILYVILALSIGYRALGEELLGKLAYGNPCRPVRPITQDDSRAMLI